MKNKPMTYALLVLAMAVWGGIFFRFFSALKDDSAIPLTPRKRINKAELVALKEDTFVLLNNYKDPFLGNLAAVRYSDEVPSAVRVSKPKVPKPKIEKPVVVPVVEVKWPSLKYLGVIKNKNTDKLVGILQLNGEEQMVLANEFVAGIKVLGLHKDTIGLEYQQVKKTLYKGQSFP